ncbi:unnamed protein product [Alopecurus aequalis]
MVGTGKNSSTVVAMAALTLTVSLLFFAASSEAACPSKPMPSSPTADRERRWKNPCCKLIGGLTDLDAAVCLCAAVKANVLGLVDLDLPIQLGLIVNHCGKKLPAGFQCNN